MLIVDPGSGYYLSVGRGGVAPPSSSSSSESEREEAKVTADSLSPSCKSSRAVTSSTGPPFDGRFSRSSRSTAEEGWGDVTIRWIGIETCGNS